VLFLLNSKLPSKRASHPISENPRNARECVSCHSRNLGCKLFLRAFSVVTRPLHSSDSVDEVPRLAFLTPMLPQRVFTRYRTLVVLLKSQHLNGVTVILEDSQLRGSISNCQSGRQSNSQAKIMKATRAALKRKRWPMAVINSTVARRTVMRTY